MRINRKRILAAVIGMTISLLAVGCGSGTGTGSTEASSGASDASDASNASSVANASDTLDASNDSEAANGSDALNAANASWPAQEKLLETEASAISSISYTSYTEDGGQSNVISNPEEIEEIYLRLCNVRMAKPTQMDVTDDDLWIDVAVGDETLSFQFEGDILVLNRLARFEVTHLGELKRYLWNLADESAAKSDGEKVFASERMDFSFLYDGAHTAYITERGAAELAMNGDESLKGLFVSVRDGKDMPEVSQLIEEDMFEESQRYQSVILQAPAENELTLDGHTLRGYIYSYSGPENRTVDAASYIEVRDGRYIFYRMKAYRNEPDMQAIQDALEKVIQSMEFSCTAYGESDAVPGHIEDDAP